MKKMIFLVCLAFVGCSTEDGTQNPGEPKPPPLPSIAQKISETDYGSYYLVSVEIAGVRHHVLHHINDNDSESMVVLPAAPAPGRADGDGDRR